MVTGRLFVLATLLLQVVLFSAFAIPTLAKPGLDSGIKIKAEHHAKRCEICHKSDNFDPQSGHCTRCSNLTLQDKTSKAQTNGALTTGTPAPVVPHRRPLISPETVAAVRAWIDKRAQIVSFALSETGDSVQVDPDQLKQRFYKIVSVAGEVYHSSASDEKKTRSFLDISNQARKLRIEVMVALAIKGPDVDARAWTILQYFFSGFSGLAGLVAWNLAGPEAGAMASLVPTVGTYVLSRLNDKSTEDFLNSKLMIFPWYLFNSEDFSRLIQSWGIENNSLEAIYLHLVRVEQVSKLETDEVYLAKFSREYISFLDGVLNDTYLPYEFASSVERPTQALQKAASGLSTELSNTNVFLQHLGLPLRTNSNAISETTAAIVEVSTLIMNHFDHEPEKLFARLRQHYILDLCLGGFVPGYEP